LQAYLGCCGVSGYKDFEGTPWYKRVNGTSGTFPITCCQLVDPNIVIDEQQVSREEDLVPKDPECSKR
jgi:hypothetical protein